MTPGMLLAYDADGNVIATLDYAIALNPDKSPRGVVDFGEQEESGLEHTAIWQVSAAVGSKFWPEWIGSAAHQFRVELEGPAGRKRIAALVHRESAVRRERAALEAAIAERIRDASDEPADIRDLVGGPDRPLPLEPDGRTGRWMPLSADEVEAPDRPQPVQIDGDPG